MTSPTAPAHETELHYVITVQSGGGMQNTRDGLLTVPRGTTRAQCFHHLTTQIQAEHRGPVSVLFFSLEPNQL